MNDLRAAAPDEALDEGTDRSMAILQYLVAAIALIAAAVLSIAPR
jgi:hypothetical protein